MREIKVLFAVFGLVIGNLYGQIVPYERMVDEVILLNIQAIQIAGLSNQNLAFIQQVGSGQEIKLVQDGASSIGSLAVLQQQGRENIMRVNQMQSGQTALINQSGDRNELYFVQRGNSSRYIIEQMGNGNLINAFLSLDGYARGEGRLSQVGNFNNIDVIQSGGIYLNVHQRGDLNQLTGLISGDGAPIQVTQQSGMLHEGIRVNIISIQ